MLFDLHLYTLPTKYLSGVESSTIVFVNGATEVLLACVSVARFTSARVWFFYILVKCDVLACVDCTFEAYPSVFKVLDDLWVSLNALLE